MARLTFSGLFDRHPEIKIVTHHLGGFASYAAGRLCRRATTSCLKAARGQERTGSAEEASRSSISTSSMPTRSRLDRWPALRCGLEFFGVDRVMFATDMPFDTTGGLHYVDGRIRCDERASSALGRQALRSSNSMLSGVFFQISL